MQTIGPIDLRRWPVRALHAAALALALGTLPEASAFAGAAETETAIETDNAAAEGAAADDATNTDADDDASENGESAGKATRLPETGRAIVTTARAAVQLQDADPKPVLAGTVINYSIVNGPWIWSDQHWGWINRGDVVALDESVDYYSKIIAEAKERGVDGVDDLRIALHHRGIAKLAMGQAKAALADFTEANERGLASVPLLVNIANAQRELGQLDKAVDAANEAIKTGESSQAYMVRASILFDQEYYDAALKDADRAVELGPENAEAYNDRGVIKRVLGQWRAAAEDYTRALKISPRHQQALANRGYVLKKLGRFTEAVRDYQRAIKINPNEAVVHNDLAWLLATCPDDEIRTPAEAVRHAERAVELSNRKDGRYLDTLAAAYAAAGDFGKATETGLEAIPLLADAEQFEADQRVDLYADGKPYVEKTAN